MDDDPEDKRTTTALLATAFMSLATTLSYFLNPEEETALVLITGVIGFWLGYRFNHPRR